MGNLCPGRPPRDDPKVVYKPTEERKNGTKLPPLPPVPETKPTFPDKSKEVVEALFDYEKRFEDEISFKKGEKIEVLDDTGDWCLGRTADGVSGYYPSNYVKKCDRTAQSLTAFFNEPRREVDKKLLRLGNPTGTYIVRPSSRSGCYALSVRVLNEKSNIYEVKHYVIKSMDNDKGYFINPKKVFYSCQELVDHYSSQADGLCCPLKESCPRNYIPPLQFKTMIQPAAAFTMVKKLGQGAFGEVFLGKWNRSMDVAIKTLKAGQMTDESFLEEAKVMHGLNHPNVVILLAVCTEEGQKRIITEFMCNGSLLDYLRKDESNALKLEHLIDMAAQICAGMQHLEEKRYVHRDLRAANVLVGEGNLVKVADFGLASVVGTGLDGQAKFPIRWTAPEAFEKFEFTTKSDVWSFGVLLYELFSHGKIPYAGFNTREVTEYVRNGNRLTPPTNVFEAIQNEMTNCWKTDPFRRPTFDHLHAFFDDHTTLDDKKYGHVQ